MIDPVGAKEPRRRRSSSHREDRSCKGLNESLISQLRVLLEDDLLEELLELLELLECLEEGLMA